MAGARGILDADMATVGTWIASGWRWWTGELAELVPPRWRARGTSPGWAFGRGGLVRLPGGTRTVVELDPALCLTRMLDLPAMSRGDLARFVALDVDRIMPLGGGAMLLGASPAGRTGTRMTAAVAGLPRGDAERLAAELATGEVAPRQILLRPDGGEAAAPPVDLAPALREAGLLPTPGRLALLCWTLVAFLFLLNLALFVWRDVERTAALEELVAAQRPAVLGVRRIAGRVEREEALVNAIAARRAERDALGAFDRLARVLPAGVWLQEAEWDAESLRLRGARPEGADVIAALRTLPGYEDVRSGSVEAAEGLPGGEPFDIAARRDEPGEEAR